MLSSEAVYSMCVSVTHSCPTLVTPWTADLQAPLFMGFFRQGYWSGLPFPSPGDLPDPEIEPRSPKLQADSLPTELQGVYKVFTKTSRGPWLRGDSALGPLV